MKTINIKDLKNKNKKTPDYFIRYDKAVKNGFNQNNLDEAIKDGDSLFLTLNHVILVSNNDLLRIHYKKSYQYRELWKARILNIIKKYKFEKITDKVVIEVLYIKRKNKILDYDASISCLKYIIDGIVKGGLITDDTIKEIPLINTKTIISQDVKSDKLIIHIKKIKNDSELDDFYSNEFNQYISKYIKKETS